jgi:hypothetical protein
VWQQLHRGLGDELIVVIWKRLAFGFVFKDLDDYAFDAVDASVDVNIEEHLDTMRQTVVIAKIFHFVSVGVNPFC